MNLCWISKEKDKNWSGAAVTRGGSQHLPVAEESGDIPGESSFPKLDFSHSVQILWDTSQMKTRVFDRTYPTVHQYLLTSTGPSNSH